MLPRACSSALLAMEVVVQSVKSAKDGVHPERHQADVQCEPLGCRVPVLFPVPPLFSRAVILTCVVLGASCRICGASLQAACYHVAGGNAWALYVSGTVVGGQLLVA